MEQPKVQQEAEVGANAGGPQRRHVALAELHLDTGFLCPLARPAQCLRDEVHARDLPPSGRQLDAQIPLPQPRSSARPYGGWRPLLLAREQRGDLLDDRD